MKKIATTLITAILLSACASGTSDTSSTGGLSASSLGKSAVQMYVQNKCTTELQGRSEWRLAALAMSQTQQTEWENKICGCVSEEAPNQITAADLPQLLTETGRVKVATDVTTKTVTACYKKLFTK
ncbi:hypothetical protein [Kingella negevensis]|uniref:hypothetical protein n=1 Tax=Kingella negevensis TaxID=1522312 RepID=UPI00254B22B8|nr:hypothetical protein [Kingella negevensis]MDK4679823.1 hypothetical protein [Kingella negevensis]MDK4682458.1 hypothetical protein [Kingella negevensis]MDK4690655.1 hypothetical protein [Kingella negevensis]MDK4691996.1 hypothetical protein [Kingella negevensis]MDK4699927.1 hypothetical protein [Kingella negevensis]